MNRLSALVIACSVLLPVLALAQPAPPSPPAAPPAPAPIPYKTVAEALAALKARDGNGTIVTQGDGWTTVNEPLAHAQWSFPPQGHAAYPALVRRIAVTAKDGQVSIATSTICEAPAEACKALVVEFEGMNDRITQALRARGRQGSTPPSQPVPSVATPRP